LPLINLINYTKLQNQLLEWILQSCARSVAPDAGNSIVQARQKFVTMRLFSSLAQGHQQTVVVNHSIVDARAGTEPTMPAINVARVPSMLA
jgi:hypothetical protein